MPTVLGTYKWFILLVLIISIALESLWILKTKGKHYDFKETGTNLLILAGFQLFKNYIFAGYTLVVIAFTSSFQLFVLPQNILTFIISFFVVDFVYYWYHRFSHTSKYLWAFHTVHHSSEQMNLTTSYRLNWFSVLLTPLLYFPPAIMGVPVNFIVVCYTINLLYQFFLHTEAIGTLGGLEGIIDTPSAHRVHHATNQTYKNKNFGGVLMLWDRIFKTYASEKEKAVYTSKNKKKSYNPVLIMFQGFANLRHKKTKV